MSTKGVTRPLTSAEGVALLPSADRAVSSFPSFAEGIAPLPTSTEGVAQPLIPAKGVSLCSRPLQRALLRLRSFLTFPSSLVMRACPSLLYSRPPPSTVDGWRDPPRRALAHLARVGLGCREPPLEGGGNVRDPPAMLPSTALSQPLPALIADTCPSLPFPFKRSQFHLTRFRIYLVATVIYRTPDRQHSPLVLDPGSDSKNSLRIIPAIGIIATIRITPSIRILLALQ
ncbi:uncharacterized protein LOC124392114 [Silurus meridionalis]|uniref:uncharacterized protein LOC124392114 n=1 Tax=Silurus meridionalis TaxID=175797 RepID=UPI001EEC77B3|nr:uncharacterized protein LOC124392114 [Silurus meridionalis]